MSARRRSGLGRGLDALLSTGAGEVRQVPLAELHPNRFQPRSRFDEAGLEELAGSIRSQGVVQPVLAAPRANGGYTIIAGERRWRAARRAGLDEVPVLVKEVESDRQLLEMALVENLQRSDLNPAEEAEAFRSLGQEFGISQEEIAVRVGKSRAAITNALRLLKLPPEVQDMLRDGRLTAGQARPLLALDSPERQIEVAERAVAEGWSARRLEELVSGKRRRAVAKKPKSVDPDTAAAADRLTRSLQTQVEIRRRGRAGTLRIHFHSEEELMRLYEILTAAGRGDDVQGE